MPSLWSELRADARSLVVDEVAPYKVSDRLLLRYANGGLDWIAIRHPLLQSAVLPVAGGTVTLPVGWLDVVSVMDADGGQLTAQQLVLDGATPAAGRYVIAGDALRVAASHSNVTVYYTTSYPVLVQDEETVPLPSGLEEALLYYIASRGLSQRAASSANLDRFDRRSDAGKPTDNPLLQMARDYLDLAERVRNAYPQR
jgi:hypothetical protein